MKRLALAAAFILCASSTHAQEPLRPSEPGPIAESAERIAQELWPTDPASYFVDEQGRPRFRTGVAESLLIPPWQPIDSLALAPAQGALSRREMLRAMTPQEFAIPLISVSVDPGNIYNGFKQAWREWQARRIHERVVREVEELERLRAAEEASK